MALNLQAMPRLVPLREFIVSPGFAGAAAVISTVIVLCAVLYASRRASRQRERHHQQAREDEQRVVAIQRCWERLKWLVETAGIEPAASEGASLGLGPELALELLRGLLRDAEQLCDDALDAVTVYQHQFSLVLAQQGGPLSELVAAASSSGDGTSVNEPASSLGPRPDKQPTTSTDETTSATAEVAASGRRRRR